MVQKGPSKPNNGWMDLFYLISIIKQQTALSASCVFCFCIGDLQLLVSIRGHLQSLKH